MSNSNSYYRTGINYSNGQQETIEYVFSGNLTNKQDRIHDNICTGSIIYIDDSEKGNIAICSKCKKYWKIR